MMLAFHDTRRLVIALVSVIVTFSFFITLHRTRVSESWRVRIGIGQDSERAGRGRLNNDLYRIGAGIIDGSPPVLANGVERLAYVTYLSGTADEEELVEEENYFIATRILVWQLLHKPSTRANGIDVIVMVTPTVPKSRRDRLARDGAIVHPVELLDIENNAWLKAAQPRWNEMLTKIRAWELTQYSRILLLEGDTMLRLPLDGVFDDKGADIRDTKQLDDETVRQGRAAHPPNYLLGSLPEVYDSSHDFPPKEGTGLKKAGTMGAGFVVLAPSPATFNYYVSLLNTTNSFDPKYPEQNLLNYAHRRDGPMPWTALDYKWNIRCPAENDFQKGLVSMHEKWWTQPYIHENQKVKDFLLAQRWEMKGWYDAWDLRNA